MGKLTDIVKKITQKVEEKYTFTKDNFIIEKKQPIGKTEQLSDFQKRMEEFDETLIKTKKCIICGAETTGTICGKDSCYDKFEKL